MARAVLCRALPFVAVAVAAVGPQPAPAAVTTCRSGETVKETARYRIFRSDGSFLACLKSARRPVELYDVDSNLGPDFTSRFRVSGRFIAYVAETASSQGYDSWLEYRNLETGRGGLAHNGPGVVDVELRATGSLAYTVVCTWEDCVDDDVEIWRVRRVRSRWRPTERLASAADIDYRSLRRSGATVSWIAGGELRSATLP